MKLISMIAFVKKQGNIGMEIQSISHQQSDRARRFYLIQKYADFLLKDLKKGMFVPCDEFDNILEEPKNYKEWVKKSLNTKYDLDLSKYEEYQKAKDRVLFKGFKVVYFSKKSSSVYSGSISDSSGIIHLFWLDKITETWGLSHGVTNIETLTVFNSIELTETALKEIGLF